MKKPDPHRIDRMLDGLWERVQSAGAQDTFDVPPGDWTASERDLWKEAHQRLQSRLNQERERNRKILDAREEGERLLKEQVAKLQRELERLRAERVRRDDDVRTASEAELLAEAERQAELQRQLRYRDAEEKIVQRRLAALEAERLAEAERAAAAQERWLEREKQWADQLAGREAESAKLSESIQTLQGELAAAKARADAGRREVDEEARRRLSAWESELRRLKDRLKLREDESRQLESFLEHLRLEAATDARERREAESTLRAAQERASLLSLDADAVRRAWESERSHWRELWENDRTLRQAWLARPFTSKIESFPPRPADEGARRGVPRFGRRTLIALGAVATAAALAITTFVLIRPYRAFPYPSANLGGIALRGQEMFAADWATGQIMRVDVESREPIRAAGAPSADLHPTALAAGGDRLWSLDAWSGRLSEHAPLPPFDSTGEWAVPDAIPADIAWDGTALWMLDAENQLLLRHVPGSENVDRRVPLPSGWRATALDFADGRFWVFDESIAALRMFDVQDRVRPAGAWPLPLHREPAFSLSGFRVAGGAVWTWSDTAKRLYRWPVRRRKAAAAFGRICPVCAP